MDTIDFSDMEYILWIQRQRETSTSKRSTRMDE